MPAMPHGFEDLSVEDQARVREAVNRMKVKIEDWPPNPRAKRR